MAMISSKHFAYVWVFVLNWRVDVVIDPYKVGHSDRVGIPLIYNKRP